MKNDTEDDFTLSLKVAQRCSEMLPWLDQGRAAPCAVKPITNSHSVAKSLHVPSLKDAFKHSFICFHQAE